MRTNRLLLLIGSAVVLAFSSCTRENPVDSGNTELTAIYSQGETRTSYSDNNGTNFSWDTGDEIAILLNDRSVVTGTLTPYDDPTRAKVTYPGGTRAYYAFYPKECLKTELGFTYEGEEAYYIHYPDEYEASDYYAPLPMYAENDNASLKLLFEHLCSLLRITCHNIPSEAAYLKVTVSSRDKLTGNVPMLPDYKDYGEYFTYWSGVQNPGQEILFTLPPSVNRSELNLNVPLPFSYENFKIYAYDSNDVILKELLLDYPEISKGYNNGYHATIDFDDPYFEIVFGGTHIGYPLNQSVSNDSYSASMCINGRKGLKYIDRENQNYGKVHVSNKSWSGTVKCREDHIFLDANDPSSGYFYFGIRNEESFGKYYYYRVTPTRVEILCSGSAKNSAGITSISVNVGLNSSTFSSYGLYQEGDSEDTQTWVTIPMSDWPGLTTLNSIYLQQGPNSNNKFYAIRVYYERFSNPL